MLRFILNVRSWTRWLEISLSPLGASLAAWRSAPDEGNAVETRREAMGQGGELTVKPCALTNASIAR
jgi:hypothetical protein